MQTRVRSAGAGDLTDGRASDTTGNHADRLSPPTPDAVHVWVFPLDCPQSEPALHILLSAQERDRAARLMMARDRLRFIVSHGMLRRILGGYLAVPPSMVEFQIGRYGKPALHTRHPGGLRFNLSHSGGIGACAVTCGRAVGIDIEQLRTDRDHLGLAARWFSPAERAALASLPSALRLRAFYRCWTCKEAYLKALGYGLLLPLDSFDVGVHPDEPPRVLRRAADDPQNRWRLVSFDPSARAGCYPTVEVAGILAVEGSDWTMTVRGTDCVPAQAPESWSR